MTLQSCSMWLLITLGLRGINSVEQLAKVKQVIVEAVPK